MLQVKVAGVNVFRFFTSLILKGSLTLEKKPNKSVKNA